MSDRHELHSLIDQLPDDKLEQVAMMLRHTINPPPRPPEMDRMRERGREFRTKVEPRFRETLKPGTISGMGGGGGTMMKDGAAYGPSRIPLL